MKEKKVFKKKIINEEEAYEIVKTKDGEVALEVIGEEITGEMQLEVTMKQAIDIVELIENEEGTMTLRIDMSLEALKVFASIGLLETIKDKAEDALADGRTDTEGAGNAEAGEGSNPPVHGEFPGF